MKRKSSNTKYPTNASQKELYSDASPCFDSFDLGGVGLIAFLAGIGIGGLIEKILTHFCN